MPRLARSLVMVATLALGGCGSRPARRVDGGGTGAGAGDGAAADAGGGGGSGGSGGSACPSVPDATTKPACSNGLDDDGDGLVDALDPDCITPYDNDEAIFGGVPGDAETCVRDCQFDGNTGMADDLCDWRLQCDPAAPSPSCGPASSSVCGIPISQHCRDSCLPFTPNGCDCFGCCAVDVGGTRRTVLISERIPCSSDTLADPSRCPSCTQNSDCLNPCSPGEICFAGAAPASGPLAELAPRCSQGQMACGPGAMAPCLCPSGTYCVTGCCVPFPPQP